MKFSICHCFFLAMTALFFASAAAQQQDSWSDSDSRLANHYLSQLQKDPEYGHILDLLWQLYAKNSQTELLLDYLKQASSADTAYVPKLIYAHLLRKNNDLASAKNYYKIVTRGLPKNIPAIKALAEIAELESDTARALNYYNRLTKLVAAEDEGGVAIRLRQAAIHRQQKQVDRAVDIWKEVLAAKPDSETLRSQITSQLLEVGRVDEAISILEQQTKSSLVRNRLKAYSELQRVYEFKEDFEGSVQACRDALSILHVSNHQHKDFFQRLVRLHERFDQLSALEKSLTNQVTEKLPSEASLLQLADFYQLTTDYENEEKVLEKLTDTLPKNISYRVRLAELQLANGRFDVAGETLDEFLDSKVESIPLSLILLRTKIDISAENVEAGEQRLLKRIKQSPDDSGKITEFARTYYLNDVVESIMRESAKTASSETASLDLARFLHQRNQTDQAIEVIEQYIETAASSKEKSMRMHQAANTYTFLDQSDRAMKAIDAALLLDPEQKTYLSSKAKMLSQPESIGDAIAIYEQIWQLETELQGRSEIDQKIFTLLRAHSEVIPVYPPQFTPSDIKTVADYRRVAAAIARLPKNPQDGPTQSLLDYYQKIQGKAEEENTLIYQYRAAWWAFKLQKQRDCYQHLQAAKKENDKPSIEVEQLLLDLAEQAERPIKMKEHLEVLIKIDAEQAEEYQHRLALVRFELGEQDVAIRELTELAANPDASIGTLASLAKVYREIGSKKSQVQVWRTAYGNANIFEKRKIVRQLSNTLVEQKQYQAALEALMDLIKRETDLIQRRKLFESQLTIAGQHGLHKPLEFAYQVAAQEKPFDIFYPEALGAIYKTSGNDRESFAALKKAYYLSDNNPKLLEGLTQQATALGELDAALYYSRQQLANRENESSIEKWEQLVGLLEQDLRIEQADELRVRLENRFSHNPEFLARLAGDYREAGQLISADRVYTKRVDLRQWDVRVLFDLAITKVQLGDTKAAQPLFSEIIELTKNETLPAWAEKGLYPIIDSKSDPDQPLEKLNFEFHNFPLIPSDTTHEMLVWQSARSHQEFSYFDPREPYAIRLRAIEELGKCIVDDAVFKSHIANLSVPHEKWWLAHYARSTLVEVDVPESGVGQYTLAKSLLLAGGYDRLTLLCADSANFDEISFSMALASCFAAYRLVRDGELQSSASLWQFLRSLDIPEVVAGRMVNGWQKNQQWDSILAAGDLFGKHHPERLAEVAGWLGEKEMQGKYFDTYLAKPIEFELGGYLPREWQIAYIESCRLDDSRKLETIGSTPLAKAQLGILNTLLTNQSEQPAAQLNEFNKQILALKPTQADYLRFSKPTDGWERLLDEYRFYKKLFTADLADAFGGPLFSRSAGEWSKEKFEAFEIERGVDLLSDKPLAKRIALIDGILKSLDNLDSGLKLARELERIGFNRESAYVFYRLIKPGEEDYSVFLGLFRHSIAAQYPDYVVEVMGQLEVGKLKVPYGISDEYLKDVRSQFAAMKVDGASSKPSPKQDELEVGAKISQLKLRSESIQAKTELLSLLLEHRPNQVEQELEVCRYFLNKADLQSQIDFASWVGENSESLQVYRSAFDNDQWQLFHAFLTGDLSDWSAEADQLAILVELGDIGHLEQSKKRGPEIYPGSPAKQLALYTKAGDTVRLKQSFAVLLQLADSYDFDQLTVDPDFSSLPAQATMPVLLDQLGHPDLADQLFTRYYASIRTVRREHLEFVSDYFDFLVRHEKFARAQQLGIEINQKSIEFDLRKIVTLYQKWGKLDSIEQDTAQFNFTSIQLGLIQQWRTALAEGREMVEYSAQ